MTSVAGDPVGLTRLVEAGTLDAELAALVWLLVEARTPVVVAGTGGAPREPVRDALIGLLPASVTARMLAGPGETFSWLPEAAALGWHAERSPGHPGGLPAPLGAERARPDRTVLVADLDPVAASPTWGAGARVAIRALSLGYGMLAVAPGTRLETVLGALAAPPVAAVDDELASLGVVLIIDPEVEPPGRVAAAHYLRPVARDGEGHVQRRPPAVLATWDPARKRFEHFAWGILDELAGRIGMTPAAFERAQAQRMQSLGGPGPGSVA